MFILMYMEREFKENAALMCCTDLLQARQHHALVRPKQQGQGWNKQALVDCTYCGLNVLAQVYMLETQLLNI